MWVEISARVMPPDESGVLTTLIGTTRRIDDRKKVEAELLEKQKELEYASITKDKFLSIIAHDLRNPFSALISISDLLKDQYQQIEPEDAIQFIEVINSSAVQAHTLLENLLEWARAQSGGIAYTPLKENLDLLVRFCIDSLELQAMTKNIKLKQINNLDECFAVCDEAMIATVIRNLISNAIKFSHNNSVIEIGISDYVDDSNYWKISIKDSGVGMSKDTVGKLFKVGENFSTYGTNKETGTGLGLLLCKEFIDKHDCKIWAESEQNVGTTFFFTLPKQQATV
jgi:signal transduction histidine kinase